MTQLMFIHGYSWFREAFRYNTHVHSCACVVYYLTIVSTLADRAGTASTTSFPSVFAADFMRATAFLFSMLLATVIQIIAEFFKIAEIQEEVQKNAEF